MRVSELVAALQDKHPDAEVWVAVPGEDSRPVVGVDLSDHGPLFTFVYTK